MNEHDLAEQQPMIELMVQTSRVWGTRVYVDGRVDEYSDREVRFVDGRFHEQVIPLAWRPLTRLTAAELTELKQQIDAIGFFQLPAKSAPDSQLQDGTITVWKVTLDERVHEVVRRSSPATVDSGLEQLRKTMEKMTAVALRRNRQP